MSIKDDDLIIVRNRNRGTTGYTIDDKHRKFNVGETKKIPFGELKALQSVPGGDVILNECLVIENEEALDLLNMKVEPEYFYTEEDIKKILLDGTLDEFEDFFDFAPEGAIDIAKLIAVKEELPDTRKRDIILKKTGLNINSAIQINHMLDDDGDKKEADAPKQRRVQVQKEELKAEGRRAATPEYKIVSKK